MPVHFVKFKVSGQYIAASDADTKEAVIAKIVKQLEFETFSDMDAAERRHPELGRMDKTRLVRMLD